MLVVPTAVFWGFNPCLNSREARQEGGGAEEGRKRKVRKEPQTNWIIKENLILQQTINGGGWMH